MNKEFSSGCTTVFSDFSLIPNLLLLKIKALPEGWSLFLNILGVALHVGNFVTIPNQSEKSAESNVTSVPD